MTHTAEPATVITLDAAYDGGWSPFVITGTADQILAYVSRVNAEWKRGLRGSAGYINLDERVDDGITIGGLLTDSTVVPTFAFGPLTPGDYRLLDYLYPTCEHGMSATSCYGPDHFMSREQEMALAC